MRISVSEFTFENNSIFETKQVSNFVAEIGYGTQKDFSLRLMAGVYCKETIEISKDELIIFARTGKFQDFWHSLSPGQFLKVLDANRILQDLGINYFLG